MFNSKLKEKINSLEDSVRRQGILLAEKESELRIMQQKVSYAEGRLDSSKEMIQILKTQLKEEVERVGQLQKTFILQQSVNHEKLSETIGQIFEEDEQTVEGIYNDMKSGIKDVEEGDL